MRLAAGLTLPTHRAQAQAGPARTLQLAHASQDEDQVLFGRELQRALRRDKPAAESELPPMLVYDIHHSRIYMYGKARPLYPFGFGLR